VVQTLLRKCGHETPRSRVGIPIRKLFEPPDRMKSRWLVARRGPYVRVAEQCLCGWHFDFLPPVSFSSAVWTDGRYPVPSELSASSRLPIRSIPRTRFEIALSLFSEKFGLAYIAFGFHDFVKAGEAHKTGFHH
jgi:hypothetical protein